MEFLDCKSSDSFAPERLDLVGRDDPWTEQRPKCFGVPLSHRQFDIFLGVLRHSWHW